MVEKKTTIYGVCTLHLHLHLSRSHCDRWGTTDIATLSLRLILFSASLRASQNFNPSMTEMLRRVYTSEKLVRTSQKQWYRPVKFVKK